MTSVYLVGDKDSLKKNSYEAMTSCLKVAEEMVLEQAHLCNIRTIEVKEGYNGKRKQKETNQ
jgi:hypothetical protein